MPDSDAPPLTLEYPEAFAELIAADQKAEAREKGVSEFMRTRGALAPGVGAFQMGLGAVGSLGQRAGQALGVDLGDPDETNRYYAEMGRQIQERIASRTPEGWRQQVAGALPGVARSMAENAFYSVGGPVGMILGGASSAANQGFTEAVDAGLSRGDATKYALSTGAIEGVITAAMSRVGLGGLERGLAPTAKEGAEIVAKKLTSRLGAKGAEALIQMAAENAEETAILIGNTMLQEGMGVDPNAGEEFWDRLGDTLLQTSLGAGLAESVRSATSGTPAQEIARQTAKNAGLAPPGTSVQTANLEPAEIVERRTVRQEPSREDRIQMTGIVPSPDISDPAYQTALDDVAAEAAAMPELRGTTIERHDNSLRIRFGDQGGNTEVVVASPREMAENILRSPDQGWASMAEHQAAEGMTRAKWIGMSRAKKLALLEDRVQATILPMARGDAVPMGVDSIIYMVEGRKTGYALQEEIAHRAFTLRATDQELSTLNGFMNELGIGGDFGSDLRSDRAFQEAIVERLYRPYVAGELTLPETRKTGAVRRIMDRIQNFFRRLLGLAERVQSRPEISQQQVDSLNILESVQSGEIQQRAENQLQGRVGDERVLQERLRGVRSEARAEAAEEVATARALSASDRAQATLQRAEAGRVKAQGAARAAPVEAQAREQRAETARERAARQGLEEEARGQRLPRDDALREESLSRRETREQRLAQKELTAARREEAQTRNKRLTADEAAELNKIQRDINTAEEILLSDKGSGITLRMLEVLRDLKRKARAVRTGSRAARTENTALSAEGSEGPLAALTPSAPQPEVRAAEQGIQAREGREGHIDRMLRMGELIVQTQGWRGAIEMAEQQTAELGPGRLSDPVRAALVVARQQIRGNFAQYLRTGKPNRFNQALKRAEVLAQQNYGEAGLRLGELRWFNEASGPLDKAEAIYEIVTKPRGKVERRIRDLRRRGREKEAEALESETKAQQWQAYQDRLTRAGLKPEDVMRDNLGPELQMIFAKEATDARYSAYDKIGAAIGLAQRNVVLGPMGALRIGLMASPGALLAELSAQGARSVLNTGVQALTGGMLRLGPNVIDYTRAVAAGLSMMRLTPQLTLETMAEGHSAVLEIIKSDQAKAERKTFDPLDPGNTGTPREIDILIPDGTVPRKWVRRAIDANSRLYGAVDQGFQAFMAGFATHLGAVEYLRGRDDSPKPGTEAYDKAVALQTDPNTRNPEVQNFIEESVLELSAANSFDTRRWWGQAMNTVERGVSNSPPMTRAIFQSFLMFFRTSYQSAKQFGRAAPLASAVLLVSDLAKARSAQASFLDRQRAQVQLYKTVLAHSVPMLLAMLMDPDSAEEAGKGNLAGVNAEYTPLVGELLVAHGKFTVAAQAWLDDRSDRKKEAAVRDAANTVMKKFLTDLVPANRLLGTALSRNGDLVDYALKGTPLGRVAEAAAQIDPDKDPAESVYQVLGTIAPIRDFLRLTDDEFIEATNKKTRRDFIEAGLPAALGLREPAR